MIVFITTRETTSSGNDRHLLHDRKCSRFCDTIANVIAIAIGFVIVIVSSASVMYYWH